MAILTLPFSYQIKLRTTNHIERVNWEIRRREKVITIFNSIDNVYRIIGSILIELNESWVTNRIYLDMKEYKNQQQT